MKSKRGNVLITVDSLVKENTSRHFCCSLLCALPKQAALQSWRASKMRQSGLITIRTCCARSSKLNQAANAKKFTQRMPTAVTTSDAWASTPDGSLSFRKSSGSPNKTSTTPARTFTLAPGYSRKTFATLATTGALSGPTTRKLNTNGSSMYGK